MVCQSARTHDSALAPQRLVMDNNKSRFTASAPASFMIAGEHAVLHGYPAIVGTLAKRLQVCLRPTARQTVTISSPTLGEYQTSLDQLSIERPFQYILAALCQYQQQLPGGVNIEISSDFSHQVGFGSSAAVTVATLAAIKQWLGMNIDQAELLLEGRALVQQTQGLGSGADIAASVYGGVVYYDPKHARVEPLPQLPVASLCYIGYKTPTAEVVQHVQQREKQAPEKYQQLYTEIGEVTEATKNALLEQDWPQLAANFTAHQQLQQQLGTSDQNIEALRTALVDSGAYGASKISGSGLGDCVLALRKVGAAVCVGDDLQMNAALKPVISPQNIFEVKSAETGVRIDG